MADAVPYAHTPLADIAPAAARIRSSFLAHSTRPLEFRQQQLRRLYWGLKDNEALVTDACRRDLGKSGFETYLTELGWVLNDIVFLSKNLARFARDERPRDITLSNRLFAPRIRKEPLGAALIIGAFNFPIQLSLGPLIGAIAAGCTAVLKPSEGAPHAAAAMARIIADSLDPACYTCIQGAVPETTALLELKWDTIFYTGSASVGTIVAKKAAESLTPVTLELGGRNPAIITANADVRLAARRLLWAKTLNAGQVCVSQNFILVERPALQPLVRELDAALRQFYPSGARASPDYGRIASKQHFDRLTALLASTSGTILLGGATDESDLYIEPTIIEVSSPSDPLIQSESFGPFIPLLAVPSLASAIEVANDVHSTPLGLYAFGTPAETELILAQTRSGGASLNDGFAHASIPTLAFGGVGSSGSGAYRGKASFDVFSHRRSVTTTPGWMERLLDVKYPPYSRAKWRRYAAISELRPDFDREGRTVSWAGWLLGLLGVRSVAAVLGK